MRFALRVQLGRQLLRVPPDAVVERNLRYDLVHACLAVPCHGKSRESGYYRDSWRMNRFAQEETTCSARHGQSGKLSTGELPMHASARLAHLLSRLSGGERLF